MGKMGRPKGSRTDVYQYYIKLLDDNADKIKEFKAGGMSTREIIKQLGIPNSTYYRMIQEKPELGLPDKLGKLELVFKLKNELVRQAFTHKLTTTKTYTKIDNKTGEEITTTETTEKEVDGSVTAIHLLLKNNDYSWSDNPSELELKMKEFNWKKKKDCEEMGLVDDKNEDDDEDENELENADLHIG